MTKKRKALDKAATAQQIKTFNRVALGQFPTPLQYLPRLTKFLAGPKLFVKRDDQTGLATGGNKTRKLEFLFGEALAKNADLIMTAGAPQSNSCRQSAAAAALCGLECFLVLGGKKDDLNSGNFFLDRLLGVKTIFTTRENRTPKLLECAEEFRKTGRNPYVIPIGGSNAIGTLGYIVAMYELMEQCKEQSLKIDNIVFATSSGGTQAGLELGARAVGFEGRILGISIDQTKDGPASNPAYGWQEELRDIANSTAQLLNIPQDFTSDSFEVNYDYLAPGYGVVTELERDATIKTAQLEGLLLDPVYSARAMGGLFDLIAKNQFGKDETVLFWHTGGTASLFAYTDEIFPFERK